MLGWYLMSLCTLWLNRYLVADLKVDHNILSLAQLGVSVIGGILTELTLVGWSASKVDVQRVCSEGFKDVLILGCIRIATILFGLIALKYIAVSFTQTIKSSAPFFTVILTYILLGQRTKWRISASLIPIVMGLVLSSLSDSSFHLFGFTAALMANVADCIQNVLSKKIMNRSYTASQLLLYTSFFAMMIQIPYAYYVSKSVAGMSSSALDARVLLLLIVDGGIFYSQSLFAYALMSLISPVAHSVANCVKRAVLITLSIYRFGEQVTFVNWTGILLVMLGVYAYSMAVLQEERKRISGLPKHIASASTYPKPGQRIVGKQQRSTSRDDIKVI